jgi:hypothetical protein
MERTLWTYVQPAVDRRSGVDVAQSRLSVSADTVIR